MKSLPDAVHGERDFDFLLGRWQAANRRLTKVFAHAEEWVSFATHTHCTALLNGLGNLEELRSEDGDVLGMTLRVFNRTTGRWQIWWINAQDGVMQEPVMGTFQDGEGIFEGDDAWEGHPIRVRYTWSDLTPTSARWQQAFSQDEGSTWETNWVIHFSRTHP